MSHIFYYIILTLISETIANTSFKYLLHINNNNLHTNLGKIYILYTLVIKHLKFDFATQSLKKKYLLQLDNKVYQNTKESSLAIFCSCWTLQILYDLTKYPKSVSTGISKKVDFYCYTKVTCIKSGFIYI
jgi:hypothetical protein